MKRPRRELDGLDASGNRARMWSRPSRAKQAADAAGHRPGGVDLLAAQELDDLLAELPQANAPRANSGSAAIRPKMFRCGRVAVQAQEQVGRAQVEEATARATGRSGPGSSAGAASRRPAECVTARIWSPALAEASRWLTGQMPQTRAVIPAISQSGRPTQNFSKPRNSATWNRASAHLARVVELDRDLGVALDPRHGVDDDLLCHAVLTLRCGVSLNRT